MSYCMCGAWDCRKCHPENFELVDGKHYYIGDREEAEAEDPEEDDDGILML